jgi:hypothetical protein
MNNVLPFRWFTCKVPYSDKKKYWSKTRWGQGKSIGDHVTCYRSIHKLLGPLYDSFIVDLQEARNYKNRKHLILTGLINTGPFFKAVLLVVSLQDPHGTDMVTLVRQNVHGTGMVTVDKV